MKGTIVSEEVVNINVRGRVGDKREALGGKRDGLWRERRKEGITDRANVCTGQPDKDDVE